jgi:hypothetical protein
VGTWRIVDGNEDLDAVEMMPVNTPESEYGPLLERGQDKRTQGFVGVGVGSAAVIGGVLWLALAGDDSTTVTMSPRKGGGMLAWGGNF